MKIGEHVADFELPDQYGQLRRLIHLLEQGPVVLFFYPQANSGGCTQEARRFRDLASGFGQAGAQIVGVSMDPVEDQSGFDRDNNLGFPLLSDIDGEVATAFGVRRKLLSKVLPVKRSTFIINPDATVREIISSETNMNTHADEALAALARDQENTGRDVAG